MLRPVKLSRSVRSGRYVSSAVLDLSSHRHWIDQYKERLPIDICRQQEVEGGKVH